MQKMIEFRHVRKAYGDKVILRDFNLCVEKGEFVTVIGSSGCGKTTALKMINGLLEPDGGEILVALLQRPATEFAAKLVGQERLLCHLPEGRLGECGFSGAAAGRALD